jgi:hypothetical protein
VYLKELAVTNRDGWPEATSYLLLLAAIPPLLLIPLNHDVVWQLWIGREMTAGAQLYVDILEINPPLWFWIAQSLNVLAESIRAPATGTLIIAFGLTIGISITLLSHLISDKRAIQRFAVYAAVLTATIVLPLNDFGQREHFVLIVSIPYCALIASRLDGKSPSNRLASAIGLLAALGFALKHYFVLVPLALELLLFLSRRADWRALRAETVVLGTSALTYAACIFIFAPEFIKTMVPLVRLAYDSYNVQFSEQLQHSFVGVYLFAGFGFLVYGWPASKLSQALIVASVMFLGAYFLQQKGFRYQALPATGLMFLGIVMEIMEARLRSFRQRAGASMLSLALLFPIVVAIASGTYFNSKRIEAELATEDLSSGDVVLTLGANPSDIWPMNYERGLVWPSRHFAFWMLPTFAKRTSPELEAFADRVRLDTAHDIACLPPDRILVSSTNGRSWKGVRSFDILGFFRANKEFEEVFRQYSIGHRYGRFQGYDLVGKIDRPDNCRPRSPSAQGDIGAS